MVRTPEGGLEQWVGKSAATSRWGVVRITTAAPAWQQHVFNDWAQVTVQSTGAPGSATLRATARHLMQVDTAFQIR